MKNSVLNVLIVCTVVATSSASATFLDPYRASNRVFLSCQLTPEQERVVDVMVKIGKHGRKNVALVFKDLAPVIEQKLEEKFHGEYFKERGIFSEYLSYYLPISRQPPAKEKRENTCETESRMLVIGACGSPNPKCKRNSEYKEAELPGLYRCIGNLDTQKELKNLVEDFANCLLTELSPDSLQKTLHDFQKATGLYKNHSEFSPEPL